MQQKAVKPVRKAGRGIRPWLLLGKSVGLLGFVGGMGALAALTHLAPEPQTQDEWKLLVGAMRSIFFPCVFCGLLVLVVFSLLLFSRHWREFSRMRWLRVKFVLLAISLPSLHFWARGGVMELYEAVGAEDMSRASELWQETSTRFLVAFIVLLIIAGIAKFKPRLKQPIAPARRNKSATD